MTTLIGIDYGLERTGIAIAYDSVILPVTTLRLAQYGTRKELLNSLCALAKQKKADALVMGLPLLEDGSEPPTCRIIRNVAQRISRRLPEMPIHFMPELLSSHDALQMLKSAQIKNAKSVLDQAAACGILKSFLAKPQNKSSP